MQMAIHDLRSNERQMGESDMTIAMDTRATSRGNARVGSGLAAVRREYFCFPRAGAFHQERFCQRDGRQGEKCLPTRDTGNCGSGVNSM